MNLHEILNQLELMIIALGTVVAWALAIVFVIIAVAQIQVFLTKRD